MTMTICKNDNPMIRIYDEDELHFCTYNGPLYSIPREYYMRRIYQLRDSYGFLTILLRKEIKR